MFATVTKWLGAIATIVGIIFVGFQYFDGKWKSRIERSLNYVVIYQDPSKVAVRNEVDFGSPKGQRRDLDPTLLERFQGVADPQCVKASVDYVLSVFKDLTEVESIEGVRAIFETRCTQEFVDNVVNMASAQERTLPSPDECKNEIHEYADSLLKTKMSGIFITDINGQFKGLAELPSNKPIETKWGTVTLYDNGELWWTDEETSYYYSWPEIVFRFFYVGKDNECTGFLDNFEHVLNNKSVGALGSLHALKYFYAAISTCATSGVCDSVVACEAFHRDIGTFVPEWQRYLELWNAKMRRTEYDRIHKFLRHCFSNEEYKGYVEGKGMSGFLYVQQFTNYCWDSSERLGGVCPVLRWMAGSSADSE